jgi:hypothetical protein
MVFTATRFVLLGEEMSLDALYHWLGFSTLLVIAGVILEGQGIWSEIKESGGWRHLRHRGEKIGFALLVVGLCLELLFQTAIESADAKLKRESDIEISQLRKEAEKARVAIAQSEAETATANEAAAKANERTVELKLALEKEIAARQPRHINPQQYAQLQAALTKIADKGEITVSWKLFDEEAERFGQQILQALIDSGFVAKEVRGAFSFGMSGQAILARDLEKFQTGPSWVGAVQAALNTSLGLNFEGRQMDASFKPEFGEVSIIIAAKP